MGGVRSSACYLMDSQKKSSALDNSLDIRKRASCSANPQRPEHINSQDTLMTSSLYPAVENEARLMQPQEMARADGAAAPAGASIDALESMFPEIERDVLSMMLSANDGQVERTVAALLDTAPPMERERESDAMLAEREQQELAEAMLLSTPPPMELSLIHI